MTAIAQRRAQLHPDAVPGAAPRGRARPALPRRRQVQQRAVHAARRRRPAAVHRLLQRRQHAAGAGHHARAGDDAARGARRRQAAHHGPVADRVGVCWRSAARSAAACWRGAGIRAVASILPPQGIAAEVQLRLVPEALIASLALAVVTTLVVGLVPAWNASRQDLANGTKESGKGTGAGHTAWLDAAGPRGRRGRPLAGPAARRRPADPELRDARLDGPRRGSGGHRVGVPAVRAPRRARHRAAAPATTRTPWRGPGPSLASPRRRWCPPGRRAAGRWRPRGPASSLRPAPAG